MKTKNLFNKDFWLGVFAGFVLFVVVLLGFVYYFTEVQRRTITNADQKAELLSLRTIPPSPSLSVYDETDDWSLVSLSGEQTSFSSLRGNIVFLNFWGTWCGPCVAEMPNIQRLHDSLKTDGVQFVLVSDESIEILQRFANDHRLSLPFYQTSQSVPTVFPVGSVPTTFILNKEGMVVLKQIGSAEWDHPWAIAFLRQFTR